jgi:hypothetical protein
MNMAENACGECDASRPCRSVAVTLLVCAAALAASLFAVSSASAATTYFVAPAGSGSDCNANSHANPFATIQAALACTTDGDEVSLAPSGGVPYPGVGSVDDDVTIAAEPGANARNVRVDVSPTPGPMTVPGGATVTVEGVTLACEVGLDTGLGCGSNVTNHGTLTLRGDTVIGSTAGPGIVNLSPNGGSANLTVLGSTISDNPNGEGSIPGGGIESALASGTTTAQDPSLTVANSTIADNGAGALRGGGIDIAKGSATVVNSTITGNQASGQGGGGIGTVPGVSVELSNTIVAGNTSSTGPDCLSPTPPPMTSPRVIDGPGGHNLIGNGANCETLVNGENGDQVGVPNPGLNPLANNGGPTDTVGLQTSSPAIAAADLDTCEASPISGLDQRGEPRNGSEGCDIGAYDTGGDGGIVNATYFVAPTGSDAITCNANSHANPFATIQAALACTADGDVVSLAPSGGTPYPGVGAVSNNVTIEAEPGGNARNVRVDVSPTPGAMSVPSNASVTVQGVTLACEVGLATDAACGPNVTNNGTLTLRRATVKGSTSGPGIANFSPDGGSADLRVLRTTISDNPNFAGTTFGGGIESALGPGTTTAQAPSVTVANSTIADNGQTGGNVARGGGLDVTQGSATVINSTISGNHAGAQGGGGIGTSTNNVTVELSNTIVAGNTANQGPDCLSPTPPPLTNPRVIDGPGGHNLIGDGSGCETLTNGVNGDQVGVPNPGLNPLADNGGPTDTVALQASSPAIAAADLTTCQDPPISGLDQRGQPRDASCDIGAFEAIPVDVATTATDAKIGGSIHDTANVLLGLNPTGTVTFNAYGPNDPTCAGAVAFTDTVSVAGNGLYPSANFTPTQLGTYRWTADYSGDTDNAPVSSPCNAPNESSTVSKATPTLITNASPKNVAPGAQVHDTANLSFGHNPTGQIVFRLYGPNDPTCSKAPVFTATKPVSANGNYSSGNFTPAKPGNYRWTARYSGNPENAVATSGCNASGESVTVAKATPVLSTTASPNITLGGKVHDTARLASGRNPTGKITFRLYGPGDPGCSRAPVFTNAKAVAGNGGYRSADFTPTKPGTYRWRATYSGDVNNKAVAGACNAANESVTVTR